MPVIGMLLSAPARLDGWVARQSGRLWRRVEPAWRYAIDRAYPRVLAAVNGAAAWSARQAQPALRVAVRAVRRVPWSSDFAVLSGAAALFALLLWTRGQIGLLSMLGLDEAQLAVVRKHGLAGYLTVAMRLALVVAALNAVAVAATPFRNRVCFWLIKAGAAGYAVLVLQVLNAAWCLPSALNAVDSEFMPSEVRNELWVHGTIVLLPFLIHAAGLLFLLVLRSASASYGYPGHAPRWGDRVVESVRTHGRDPVFRKSVYKSAAVHLFFIIVLPLMLFWWGCSRMSPYAVPKGSGQQVLQAIKIKKIKKPKLEKKFVVNMNTAISFYIPKIDESEVLEDVDKATEATYEAQQTEGGKLGAGGGKEGGWPNGMDKARVRFIRLEYAGGDWDQDMGIGADYNMLVQFHKLTGFNIAANTESIRVQDLLRFPKNRAPPFVYMTGGLKGNITMSQSEIKAMRKYCLDLGGMVFADNGGGNFDGSFRALMRRVFPDLPVVEIAYDDTVFRYPYQFPNGAPPLWHHSGNRALGVKYKGRWVVFYHQGDVNDAWKDGYSGASPEIAMQAFKLGVNVINYSFNQYMSLNFGDGVPR